MDDQVSVSSNSIVIDGSITDDTIKTNLLNIVRKKCRSMFKTSQCHNEMATLFNILWWIDLVFETFLGGTIAVLGATSPNSCSGSINMPLVILSGIQTVFILLSLRSIFATKAAAHKATARLSLGISQDLELVLITTDHKITLLQSTLALYSEKIRNLRGQEEVVFMCVKQKFL